MKAATKFVGRLTRDVTSIFSNDDGTAKRALFTVAVNSTNKSGDEKVKSTDFIPCIAWNKHADLLETWGLKGRQVEIAGTIETYQKPVNSDGSYDATKVQIRVSQIEFLDFRENVQEKYEAWKSAKGETAPADTNALLTGLAALLTGKAPVATPAAAPTPTPEPTPTPTPEPEQTAALSPEKLAAMLLNVINKPAATAPVEPDISAAQAAQSTAQSVANELGGLI